MSDVAIYIDQAFDENASRATAKLAAKHLHSEEEIRLRSLLQAELKRLRERLQPVSVTPTNQAVPVLAPVQISPKESN